MGIRVARTYGRVVALITQKVAADRKFDPIGPAASVSNAGSSIQDVIVMVIAEQKLRPTSSASMTCATVEEAELRLSAFVVPEQRQRNLASSAQVHVITQRTASTSRWMSSPSSSLQCIQPKSCVRPLRPSSGLRWNVFSSITGVTSGEAGNYCQRTRSRSSRRMRPNSFSLMDGLYAPPRRHIRHHPPHS